MVGKQESIIKKRWVVFGLCSGLLILSFLCRAANAVIAIDLSRDLSLTARELGFLGAAFFYIN